MKKQNGITLIALVITIIVLLILAGVSINAVIGENGIATKAQQAGEKTEIGSEKEQITVSFSDCKLDNTSGSVGYEGIVSATQLENAMNNAYGANTVDVTGEAGILTIKYQESGREYLMTQNGSILGVDEYTESHPDQSIYNSSIGISENGNLVNMDLWTFYFNETYDGYVLYEEQGSGNYVGYTGEFENGEIIGEVPMFILDKSDDSTVNEFKPVVSLQYTFFNDIELVTAPSIPSTVIYMEKTFHGCTDLVNAPSIPNSVVDMHGTFQGCTSLVNAPEIPESVTIMKYTFDGCTSLEKAPTIPSEVTTIAGIFWDCTSLMGTVTINATPTTYNNALSNAATTDGYLTLTGSCSDAVLEEIAGTASDTVTITIK